MFLFQGAMRCANRHRQGILNKKLLLSSTHFHKKLSRVWAKQHSEKRTMWIASKSKGADLNTMGCLPSGGVLVVVRLGECDFCAHRVENSEAFDDRVQLATRAENVAVVSISDLTHRDDIHKLNRWYSALVCISLRHAYGESDKRWVIHEITCVMDQYMDLRHLI